MDIASTLPPNLDPSLRLLIGVCFVGFPFIPPLLLSLHPGSEDEGTPNEILWERKALHLRGQDRQS